MRPSMKSRSGDAYERFRPDVPTSTCACSSTAPTKTVTDVRTGEEVSLMPREATFADFQRWLARNRRRDPQMQVVKNIVTVRRN